jgi:hypothetical protein
VRLTRERAADLAIGLLSKPTPLLGWLGRVMERGARARKGD